MNLPEASERLLTFCPEFGRATRNGTHCDCTGVSSVHKSSVPCKCCFAVTWQRADATAPSSQSEQHEQSTRQLLPNVKGRECSPSSWRGGESETPLTRTQFYVSQTSPLSPSVVSRSLKSCTTAAFLYPTRGFDGTACKLRDIEYNCVSPSDAMMGSRGL